MRKKYKGLKNMEFCPECGSMLLPTEDNELKCSCGYTKNYLKINLNIMLMKKLKKMIMLLKKEKM